MGWNQDGKWGWASPCPDGGMAPEHVLINYRTVGEFWYKHLYFPWDGSGPPSFRIGPNPGYVWAGFTITCYPVTLPWDGPGTFERGETEDYLIYVAPAEGLDYGDAPSSYGIASHDMGSHRLGQLVDTESSRLSSLNADVMISTIPAMKTV